MTLSTELYSTFLELTKNPELYLGTEDVSPKYKRFLKAGYDYAKEQQSESFANNALPELITDHFDHEQIWQQIELQNDAYLAYLLVDVSKYVVGKEKLIFDEVKSVAIQETVEVVDNTTEGQVSDDESSSDDDNEPLNLDEYSDQLSSDDLTMDEDNEPQRPQKKQKSSMVDDQFFKLNEMEAFLQAEEKKIADAEPDSGNDSEEEDEDETDDEEEDVDFFNGNTLENKDTERGGIHNPKYNDFFAGQDEPVAGPLSARHRNKFLEELEDEQREEDEAAGPQSTLEQREERLRRKMSALEDAAVGEKQWQLKGEITAENRPQNSLLEEVVEFDLTTRPAPVMTEQTSLQLEDIIKQRIKDKAFDSVDRKEKPAEAPLEYKKRLVVNQEKSKESLAQIYEKEYLEAKDQLDPDAAEQDEEEPQLHKDIKKMMHELFGKLDALSNFHFTPKMAQAEMKIVSNLPAINAEEVAPVATSDAALLAPEEVKAKARGDILGKSERTATDKKRERRKKKAKQHEHAMRQLKANALGLGNKHSKAKAAKMLDDVARSRNVEKMDEALGSKRVQSSTAFFAQLEEEVKTQMKSKARIKKAPKQQFVAKKLKL